MKRPQPDPRPRIPARVRLFSARVCGPSTDNRETEPMHGLQLPHVMTILIMLQTGDTATIECTESDDV